MYSFICALTNHWANNRDASDLRHHHAHYDVTVMYHGWWDLTRHCATTTAYNCCSTAVIWCKFYWNKLQVFGKSLFYYLYKEILSVSSMLMCNCKQNMMPVCYWWNNRFCNSNPQIWVSWKGMKNNPNWPVLYVVCLDNWPFFRLPLSCPATNTLYILRPRKMTAIYQMTFSNAFSWLKMYRFWLKFHWRLLLRVHLTIFQHWFR